ncbi:photosystem I assembly Ycf4 [Rubidibacter lacunae KORDI 51-2]|uniref:Photosystem I assembly protein Ycf4 n=1 Tax=Rubidibacter lacunae KORDI 51-2 TaxID=582515 RepID=U5DK06_9CHRO|nr:photosystem I assembly protein Ycf4 [Rubidibacter lacunae]ERN40015.1 photosystem I assembly Ycf4 [Rubidibacter lacunae KORDI 51-2]
MSAAITTDRLLRQTVQGSRRASNYLWAVVTAIGGIGFFLAGLSSYFHVNLLLVSDPRGLQFIPQGIALLFYGTVGSAISLYQWLTILWDLGSGYNEFDKDAGTATVFRWGFPGKNRRIEISVPLDDVLAVYADIKEGLNPKRSLYLRVKNRQPIPLTRAGEPLPLSDLESCGADLARFLGLPLEGL